MARGRRRNITMMMITDLFWNIGWLLTLNLTMLFAACPDQDPDLQIWNPGHNKEHHAHIGRNRKLLLSSSATVNSIHIFDGGKLVISDSGKDPIVLRTRNILIEDGGEFHVGSEDCPFQRDVTIILYGRSDEETENIHSYFGLKYIGVSRGGTLEIHGAHKLSWTFLNSTLHPGGMREGGYYFERSWGHRGIIVHVINQLGDVIHSDRFDTYKSTDESKRLAEYLDRVKKGLIISVAVNDEGSTKLDEFARNALSKLGSKYFRRLGFRHPWSFVTVKGSPESSAEDHVVYQGARGSAAAKVFKLFQSPNGDHFTVGSVSEWVQDVEWTAWFNRDDERGSGDWEKLTDLKSAFPGKICESPIDMQVATVDGIPAHLTAQVFHKHDLDYGFVCRNKDQVNGICHNYKVRFLCGKPVWPKVTVTIDRHINSSIVDLAEDASTWKASDIVFVASTDYSMYQTEEFQLLHCPECKENQVKLQGKAKYLHMGREVDGVDMRAEVGILSRNIVIMGEMEAQCYGNNACTYFEFDTVGGHIKMGVGFKAVHIEGALLKHMGQQSMGHYPIHFHMTGDVDGKGGYTPPTYVKEVSIHDSFSRCVTIHGSNGLLVKDVIGYKTLGHCFFTEDGPEERNTFDHCLGLLVKAGTLLPSDRDSKMCRMITDGVYPGYVPRPQQDCNAVSTFWIANPNNSLINCAAAGSEETGFWFIFHHVPTGPSEGMYSPGYSEHMPLGRFSNNRAHSNHRAGMIIDNGVKTTEANARDKRPFLSLVGARYSPHVGADPYKPREPALIKNYIAYKNQDHGAWLRGGDVWLEDCQFSDNGIGLTLASGGTFPDDDGAKQEVKNSLFVGESENRGTEMPDNLFWGPGGLDHSGRALPKGETFPMRGIQIYDGPINVENCTFRKFVALDGRHTSAIGFRFNNSWQTCPNNNMTNITFQDVPIASRVFFGEPGRWFNHLDLDGDKTTILHDVDGSVSEYPGAYIVKHDNWLLRHSDCIDVPDWRSAICSGHYAQVYIQAKHPSTLKMKIIKDEYPDKPLFLKGALGRHSHYQQYQPVVMLQKGYTVHWDGFAPQELTIWLINFNQNDWIQVGLCYPKGSMFSIISDIHNRLSKRTFKTGTFQRTYKMNNLDHGHPGRSYYFFDEDTGLLFLKVKAHKKRHTFAFCSLQGCERIKIKASFADKSSVSDCVLTAYPKYSQMPTVDVPMPKKLQIAQLSNSDHFVEVKLESYKMRFFHIREDMAYSEVNGKKYHHDDEGMQIVVIDGKTGKVVDNRSFRRAILRGIPMHVENYVANMKNNSIALVTSKGRLISGRPWMKVLAELGATDIKLKDKLVFVGYKGSFKPEWVKLAVGEDTALLHEVLPIPITKKLKL
ncbi:cell migration-inducing and hyaluronan-binding protein [Leucoraja erinacea]|uniref:cell migration-inducing and hyaluronan-binding protein n=1 Tax=Leucoraja erinaceus TaxID=7782 RepID=UPI0024569710|nr:cell migration-inducing and hyaluronan-binding protein [Leucoraja erinacea]XP_055517176.1 cell migration-inducing and hyaluronan-binding protein [Leucoraja erinacea]